MTKSKFQEKIENQQKRLEELYDKHFKIRHNDNKLEVPSEKEDNKDTSTNKCSIF